MFCVGKNGIREEMNVRLASWRTDLTEYEKSQFIPFMTGYVEGFIEYFDRIVETCKTAENSQRFWPQLEILLKKFGVPGEEDGASFTASHYYRQIQLMAESNYLKPLRELLDESKTINNFHSLALWLNKLKRLVSTILNVKENLFLFKLTGWFAVLNMATGAVSDPLPSPELAIFFVPFQAILNNLITESTYLLGSIDKWSQEQMEWKTSYMNMISAATELRNTKWVFAVNVATVVTAIVLSWVFLVAVPPFERIRLEIENEKLKEEISRIDTEAAKQQSNLVDLKAKISSLLEENLGLRKKAK